MVKRLPKRVREQEQRAEALINGEEAVLPVEEPVEEVTAEAEAQAALDEPTVDPAEEAPAEEAPAEEARSSGDENTIADIQAAQDLAREGEWEQKYKTLKGKYDSEIPRMAGTIDGMQRRIAQMEQIQTQAQAPAPVSEAVAPLADDSDDRDTYGDDFIDLVDRRVERLVEARVSKLEPQIAKVQTEVTETRLQTAQKQVYMELVAAIPDWKTINSDEKFKEWLRVPDGYTGVPRMDLLQGAFNMGSADRVIALFQGFIRETAPPPAALPTPTPRTRGNGRANLADLATPGATRTASPGSHEPLEPVPVTRKEIQTFYADAARGVYTNRQEDYAMIEGRINTAVAQGRVI
jgi:hypothetical protein